MTSEKEDPWFTHQQAQLSLARSLALSLFHSFSYLVPRFLRHFGTNAILTVDCFFVILLLMFLFVQIRRWRMKRNKTFKRLGVAGAHDGLDDQYDCKKRQRDVERTNKERKKWCQWFFCNRVLEVDWWIGFCDGLLMGSAMMDFFLMDAFDLLMALSRSFFALVPAAIHSLSQRGQSEKAAG